MAANVIRLDDHRPAPLPCCPRHALLDVVSTGEHLLDEDAASLLIARTSLELVLSQLRSTVDRLLPVTPESGASH